jgi:hypothetical protein
MNVWEILKELPPWIAVAASIGMAGALWGMKTTCKKVDTYMAALEEKLQAIEARCASRKAACDAHLDDVLEMRRKLLMEITDSKFEAVYKLIESKFDGVMDLIKIGIGGQHRGAL